MAGKEEGVDVILDDEAVVTVDVSDDPSLATTEEDPGAGGVENKEPPKTEPKPKATPKNSQTVMQPAAQDAAKQLQEAQAQRDAANATAASERARREHAERTARSAAEQAAAAEAERETAHMNLLEQGIAQSTREISALQTSLQGAYEAGEWSKVSDLQVKVGKATAALDRQEAELKAFTDGSKKTTTEGRVEPQQQGPSPFEQYVSNFAPESQTWLRAHPECVPVQVGGNAISNAKMMEGHYAALRQNIPPNSADYFRIIEEHTGHRAPVSKAAETVEAGEEEEAVETKPVKTPAKKVNPSAPPSREPPAAGTGQPQGARREVRLSKDQQEVARMSFPNMKPAEAYAAYARNLIELEAENKIGRVTH